MTGFLIDEAAGKTRATLLLAHGAGAPMDSDFMNMLAAALARQGVRVLRFEFPYMVERRRSGTKKPPDRTPVLLQAFAAALDQAGAESVFIGGKSMGGRMATMLAVERRCRGVVCFGYPFHPPGKPEKTRLDHLPAMQAPLLICQGERDPFGNRQEVESYPLPSGVQLHWLADGNHDLAPRKASGVTAEENMRSAVAAVMRFIRPGK
jgi:uncharacterized protein